MKGVDELEIHNYTRNYSNIRVYIDFERYREGGELFNFFALKSVQNAVFEKEGFAWWETVKGAVFDEEKDKGRQTSCVSYVYLCFESISTYMNL